MPVRSLERVLRGIAARQVRRDDGCLIWTGCARRARKNVNCDGYGMVRFNGKMVHVHRLIYAAHHGPIPEGLNVLHRCDHPLCGELGHLYAGTNQQNIEDKVRRGRAAKKLTAEKIIEIRRLASCGATQSALAAQYDIHPSNISRTVNGHRWAHVPCAGGV